MYLFIIKACTLKTIAEPELQLHSKNKRTELKYRLRELIRKTSLSSGNKLDNGARIKRNHVETYANNNSSQSTCPRATTNEVIIKVKNKGD